MSNPVRISYVFICGTLLLVGWLHLATPFMTVLFSYFALTKLNRLGSKPLAIALFLLLVVAVFLVFAFFIGRTYEALPDIFSKLLPMATEFSEKHHFKLPFTDLASLRSFIGQEALPQLGDIGAFAKLAVKQAALAVIGLVVAVSLFVNEKLDLARDSHAVKNNLYTASLDQIAARFSAFYQSFNTVMGAQIRISAINTTLTAIFVLSVGLPYPKMTIIATFLCGLLPIIGNIISNTLVVGIAMTISFNVALISLVFLVVVHKLEYFLNSKIIGDRIQNPMWLTLLGLILGERLMGIPGMILAPVVLYYIKVEVSKTEAPPAANGKGTGNEPVFSGTPGAF